MSPPPKTPNPLRKSHFAAAITASPAPYKAYSAVSACLNTLPCQANVVTHGHVAAEHLKQPDAHFHPALPACRMCQV
jgi:hypothetical protein